SLYPGRREFGSAAAAHHPRFHRLDRAFVAVRADLLADGGEEFARIIVRHALLELILHLTDQRRLKHGVAGHDLLHVDDEIAAALRVREHAAFALAEREEH